MYTLVGLLSALRSVTAGFCHRLLLFTGDAGSGESSIRRWIVENDWLEAIEADLRTLETEIAQLLAGVTA